MSKKNIVVVGVDGSPESDQAVEWAAHEAVRREALLRIVHVVHVPSFPVDPLLDLTGTQASVVSGARRLAETTNPAVRCETVSETGYPPRALVQLSEGASLIAVGGNHRSLLDRVVFGSVASGVLAHASCPVVLVRAQHGLMDQTTVTGPVVVGVDQADTSYDAIDFAAMYASTYALGLVAVQAWANADDESGTPKPVRLDSLCAQVQPHLDRYPRVTLVSVVANDSPAQALLEWAEKASLLVVGSRGRSALTGLVLGSVSAVVAHDAPCSVAVVKERSVSDILDDLAS